MDLLQNPFHILTASPRDNRRRVMELADEHSLLLDPGICTEACSSLTNPRKRLSAEVAWLPGIGPKRVGEVMSLLLYSPTDLLAVDKLTSIARANLLATGLIRLPDRNPDDVVEWILRIAWAFEDIDLEELGAIINEERVVSGFPEVMDISVIEVEINERRRHYRKVIRSTLDNLSPMELVKAVTITVETATNGGKEHGPILISDLVDLYEAEAREALDKGEENIRYLVEQLRGAVDKKWQDSTLALMVKQLIDIVKNWDAIAQPIQVSTKSRGLGHDASLRIAELIRDLAIHMFNKHDKLDFSQQLTSMLQEVFAEVESVAERTAEDADTLDSIAEQRSYLIEEANKKTEEWKKEITYEADVGIIVKDKLRISPEGVEWKGRRWALDAITRVRWGVTRHSINGIPTGTTYKIIFGDGSDHVQVELKKEAIYVDFIGRLWKSVGVRILTEYLEGLRDGKKYQFSSAIVSDHGMELERKKFFSRNEKVFCRWGELVIWNEGGMFCIGKKEDKKIAASLSYQDEDNIHILEAAIRMFWKRGGNRLSSLLMQE